MNVLEALFWLSVACVVYVHIAYPLIVAAMARITARREPRRTQFTGRYSVVVAAYNEQASIGRRTRELLRLIHEHGGDGELIVVSDGSNDRTAAAARNAGNDDPRLRVIELSANCGKAAALSVARDTARGDVIVLADARQCWAPDALQRLLENFDDPNVGAVSGALILETGTGTTAGVGMYWRYEKWLRREESRWHSTIGVTGAICAVRRELFCRVPEGTVLDDVYWPLRVTMQGYRVIHDDRARAFDRLPDRAGDELRRKVRTLSGNFQLFARLPAALLPWRNPVWFQVISHKLMRLLVPWALLMALFASASLPSPLYRAMLLAQLAFYGLAAAGTSRAISARLRAASMVWSIVFLNAAAWLAFWVWITGGTTRSWHKVAYAPTR
jgi:cellulose synthase/poly-beta-1,6-N-acetylglucosamine synthase-like glycosyltransferase